MCSNVFRLLFYSTVLSTVLLTWDLPVAVCKKAPARSRQKFKEDDQKQSIFGTGENPLIWERDELQELSALDAKVNFHDKEHFLASGNLAAYLGLHPIDSLHVPLHVNLVFIGFSGDGAARVKVPHDDLVAWFEHLDHVIPHTRVPLATLRCQEDGVCGPGALQPVVSAVHYNLSCQVVEVASGVALAFDRAIKAFMRPVDPAVELGDQQVDALEMEEFVDGFLEELGLAQGASLLVLNPDWPRSRGRYGYRRRLSREEMLHLQKTENRDAVLAAQASLGRAPPRAPRAPRGWQWFRPQGKFARRDAVAQSHAWATDAAGYLSNAEAKRNNLFWHAGKDRPGTAARAQALKLLRDGGPRERAYISDVLAGAQPRAGPSGGASGHRPGMTWDQECLVDVWVGRKRWLLIDLSAGDIEWGPSGGGRGWKVARSLPNVRDWFPPKAEQLAGEQDAQEYGEQRQKLAAERMARHSAIQHEQAMADMHKLRSPAELAEAGGSGGPPPPPARPPSMESFLHAELDVYEAFAARYCTGQGALPQLCRELRAEVKDIIARLEGMATAQGIKVHTERAHDWDIFGGVGELLPSDSESERAHALLMMELGAVLSGALRHVVAPPTVAWPRGPQNFTASTLYAAEVTFHLVMVHSPGQSTRPGAVPFDTDFFKAQLARLELPSQGFRLVVHPAEGGGGNAAALHAALSASLKTYVHTAGGISEDREYLDSEELERRLPTMPVPLREHGTANVPVYVFALERKHPVLIDQRYQARALKRVVVAVQNPLHPSAPNPEGLQCRQAALGIDPSAAEGPAVGAVAQFLGGLMPPQLGFSPLHGTINRAWLWAVGNNPLGQVSLGGAVLSEFQIDTVQRGYVTDALEASVAAVNAALLPLARQRASPQLLRLAKPLAADLRGLMREFHKLVEVWRAIASDAAWLNFQHCTTRFAALQQHTANFEARAAGVAAQLHGQRCRELSGPRLADWLPPLVGGAVGVPAVLALLWWLRERGSRGRRKRI